MHYFMGIDHERCPPGALECERWPAPPARDYALFAESPGATGAGALELVVIGRAIDPRELCLTPAVTERFHTVGNELCDWIWLSAGLDEPEREPWQVWPLGFDPVVYQVWTVTQREPLRVGVPAGSIWLDIDAAYDEAAMIETLHALIPPTP